MSNNNAAPHAYHRYHIETKSAPDVIPWPSRFKVKVSRPKLAKHLIKELFHYRGDMDLVLSRPCVYGVFSGPIGGFAPREQLCVGCLRCTTEHPDMVEIRHNPKRLKLGDSYFTHLQVNAITYEAECGCVPVRGAGYRGAFGGDGWDGMWTDMSEIVRPTRDGIHGREFISTAVDIGGKPSFLTFDRNGSPNGNRPKSFSIPVPFLFDAPPDAVFSEKLCQILSTSAEQIQSLVVMPIDAIDEFMLLGDHIIPLVTMKDKELLNAATYTPRLIEINGWDEKLFRWLEARFPETSIVLRTDFTDGKELIRIYDAGVRIFHLTADYHGRGGNGAFVHDLIRAAHGTFVQAGCRDEVTLLGSGGIIAAEHVAKAIIAGLDAVALDTALLIALQGLFKGECVDRKTSCIELPENLPIPWGIQRLKNVSAAWRDQLLEVLGAMGLREVRRLRGETGRVMYQKDLEREAFAEIEGYYVGD